MTDCPVLLFHFRLHCRIQEVFLSLAKCPVNGFLLPLTYSQENPDKDLLNTENQKQIMMFCVLQNDVHLL